MGRMMLKPLKILKSHWRNDMSWTFYKTNKPLYIWNIFQFIHHAILVQRTSWTLIRCSQTKFAKVLSMYILLKCAAEKNSNHCLLLHFLLLFILHYQNKNEHLQTAIISRPKRISNKPFKWTAQSKIFSLPKTSFDNVIYS